MRVGGQGLLFCHQIGLSVRQALDTIEEFLVLSADIAMFKDELKAASDKVAAAAVQNEELFNRIKGLTDAQAGLMANSRPWPPTRKISSPL